MAWSVDTIYKFILYQLRKNQAGGLKSTDFQFAWNSEQSAYQSDLLGRWQRNNNSKEGINTGLIENATIMTKLAPFTQTVPIVVVGGQAPKPADFVFAMALRINGTKVFQVDPDMIWAVNEDVIDPPSIPNNSYYYTEYQLYYSILPNSVTTVTLDYIQMVADIFWNSTLDANGRQVYNSVGSTQPLWGQNSIVDITKRCLKSLGISFKDQDFEAFGQSNIVTGD